MNENMELIKTSLLTKLQKENLLKLVFSCCSHDSLNLSYPTEEEGCHYLLFHKNGHLASALAFLPCGENVGECTAFTNPEERQNGYFSFLLEQALDDFCDFDFLFPVSGHCSDTEKTLQALEAELESTEYQMEGFTEPFSGFSALGYSLIPDFQNSSDEETTFVWNLLSSENILLGTCLTTQTGRNSVCLHHVEIFPEYRQKGYGTILMSLLCSALSKQSISKVILQVSGSNQAALALYKKTGFCITQTLSFYLY